MASKNQGDQFFCFALLCHWLLGKLGQQLAKPGQFDDPNIITGNIVNALKQLQVSFEAGQIRLRQPFGDEILSLLHRLIDNCLQRDKVTVEIAAVAGARDLQSVASAGDPEVATVDATSNVQTISAEKNLIYDNEIDEEDSDIDDYHDPVGNATTTTDSAETVYYSQPTEQTNDLPLPFNEKQWKLEIERVAPMLRVTLGSDNKDWRIHWQQIQAAYQSVKSDYDISKPKFQNIVTQIESAMEKIASREKYINSQLENYTEKFKSENEKYSQTKSQLSRINDTVNDAANELTRITQELDIIQAQMDDLGTGMTDPKPLVQIRQSRQQLEVEIKDMSATQAV